MDPISHAVVGMALGVLGDNSISMSNGIMIASTIGAIIPDSDIVVRFWGNYAYLKQHRGFSHSLPGLALFSFLLGGGLSFFYPQHSFYVLFLWAFIGALSHSALDMLNSYGVQILGPFYRKKIALNLLLLFDPIIFIFCLLIIVGIIAPKVWFVAGFFISYLILRYLMRYFVWKRVNGMLLKKHGKLKVIVMPSRYHYFGWDFIARIPGKAIIGRATVFSRDYKVFKRLKWGKENSNHIFLDSVLGRYFREFTPFFHIECRSREDKIVGRFTDLRYYVRGRFLHHGTVVLDKDMNVKEAIFQPFSPSHCIHLNS